MSEKVSVEVGVFDINPSVSDAYNIPIGLAIGRQDYDKGSGVSITILLAKHGYHGGLYDAYLSSLSEDHDPYKPDDYANKVDAVGFFNKTDPHPNVYCMERCGISDSVKELAARALYCVLESRSDIILPDDGCMRLMNIPKTALDTAIIEKN